MLFPKFISGVGPRTILAVPLRQQTDETFYVRLHFAGAAQAEFLSRAAVARMATRIAARPLFAGGIFIDLNDGRAFSQFQHLAERISRAYI